MASLPCSPMETVRDFSWARTAATLAFRVYICPRGSWSLKRFSVMSTSRGASSKCRTGAPVGERAGVEGRDGGPGRTDAAGPPTPRRGTRGSSETDEGQSCRSHAHQDGAAEATRPACEQRDGKRDRERQGGIADDLERYRQGVRDARLEDLEAHLRGERDTDGRTGRDGAGAPGSGRGARQPGGKIRKPEREREADEDVAERRERGRGADLGEPC